MIKQADDPYGSFYITFKIDGDDQFVATAWNGHKFLVDTVSLCLAVPDTARPAVTVRGYKLKKDGTPSTVQRTDGTSYGAEKVRWADLSPAIRELAQEAYVRWRLSTPTALEGWDA